MNAPGDVQAAKERLRKSVGITLDEMPAELRAHGSKAVCKALERTDVWKRAHCVLLFAPMPGEIDIWPLVETALRQEKLVALPKFDKRNRYYEVRCIANPEKDIIKGYFGIREPDEHCLALPSNILDLTLVPGVAFGLSGHRLGRGKGYYDRLLSAWRGFSCGVCFDEQIVDAIPMEPHDVPLNCILTPTRFFQPGGTE